MRVSVIASTTVTLLVLTACGVDTTGISAASSKKPRGNASSVVTVTEYGDFQCPACGGAYPLIVQPLEAKYGNKISFEFKHFPLSSIHPYAVEAAMASECAADQGKFWEFVDIDYVNQKDLSSTTLRTWAKTLGLDTDLFERCLSSRIKYDTVMAEYNAGEKLDVNSTPTFFVNGQKVPNTIDAISQALDATMAQGQSVPL